MRTATRLLAAFLFAFPYVADLRAQATSEGAVTGQVTEAGSGAPLPGANVVIEGTNVGTSADRTGRYRLSDIPAGSQTLLVSFIGYRPAEVAVDVEGGAAVVRDVQLESEVLQTGEVVVTGLREGQLRAINQKRQALSIVDVLSADAIGKLPDRNVAEAVRRVPGVSIQTDRGEGRFVSIRGTEPSLNNVTVNGQSLASSAESRATALDLVPSSMVSSIEVVKAVTPDMEGNAVGGTIDINTLTAFDRSGPFVFGSASLLQHQQAVDYRSEQLPFQGSLTAGTQFGASDQFGLVVSADVSRRDYKAAIVGPTEWLDEDGLIWPEGLETTVEDTRRDRYAVSGNFDYRPSERTSVYVRSFYARTDEFDDNAEYQFEFDDVTGSSSTAGRFAGGEGALDLELTNKDEYLLGLTLGGEQEFGAVTWSLDGTYTRGLFDRVTDKPEFVAEGTDGFSGTYAMNGDFLEVTYDDPGTVATPENYIYDEIDLEFESNTENTYVAETDVRWDTRFGPYAGFLKAGGTFRTREKVIDDLEEGFNGGTDPATLALDPVAPPTDLQGGATYPVLGDTDDLFSFFERERGNPQFFEADLSETQVEGVENDSNNDEDVYAGYAMGQVEVGRLTAVGGVRVEATETRSLRYRLVVDEAAGEQTVGSEAFTNSYVNVLPSLHLTYNLTGNLLVRAAWSNTIGRPDYEELSGFREVEITQTPEGELEGSVASGNPDLEPFASLNLDATAEYYFPRGGLLSVGGFYKRVQNPIYEFEVTERDFDFEGRLFDEITFEQDRNADVGTILGLEASYQQLLLFLPSPLDGLGISSNIALIDSEVEVPGREGDEIPFFGQSDLIYNLVPYYQQAGFEVRMALSYQSGFLDSIGDEAFTDEYFDDRLTIDLTGSYAFYGDRLEVQAQLRNLTGETERFYQGTRSRRLALIETGRSYSLGLAVSL